MAKWFFLYLNIKIYLIFHKIYILINYIKDRLNINLKKKIINFVIKMTE
jgi:hypothetical protein